VLTVSYCLGHLENFAGDNYNDDAMQLNMFLHVVCGLGYYGKLNLSNP